MNSILMALLTADPIEPNTVIALPLGAFWAGLVSLISVAVSLVVIVYKISTFTTTVSIGMAAMEKRLDQHSDQFGDNERTHHEIDKRLMQLEPRHA